MHMLSYRQDLIIISLLVLRFIPIFTRSSKSYRTIQAKSNTKRSSAKRNGPNIWNSIPAEIHVAPNMFVLKRYVRKHLTGGLAGQ